MEGMLEWRSSWGWALGNNSHTQMRGVQPRLGRASACRLLGGGAPWRDGWLN